MIKSLSFQGCKGGSVYTNDKCNTSYKQSQGQNSYDHLSKCRKSLDKIQHPFMKKLGIEGTYPNIIMPIMTNHQHHTKWGKTKTISFKVKSVHSLHSYLI
jgi:hypothetical protein